MNSIDYLGTRFEKSFVIWFKKSTINFFDYPNLDSWGEWVSNSGKTWIMRNPSKKLFPDLNTFEEKFLKETNLELNQVDFSEEPYPKI
ncbi:DUF3884 family protein [Vagococcus carniphilus]|uniref:DUF3884 family protein n=1 Tax=Vagococcus carniphilus TaxID=218144 RepID=UPI00288DDDD3|nr:DUF3884 family protein [Vagococcus carniphilus]MDT2813335.1 DUF3884 family protein [Vagococcus carniphilus]MDT2865246.1 DUF3884 family protein [Vagococcus carniphilus]